MSSEVKSLKTEKPRILGSQKIIADDLQFNEFKKAFHEELEIKYCYQGGFGVLVNTDLHYVKPGDVVIVNPYEIHANVKMGGEGRYYRLIMDLDTFDDVTYNGKELRRQLISGAVRFDNLVSGNVQLQNVIQNIVSELENKAEHYDLCVKGLIQQLTAILLRNCICLDAKFKDEQSLKLKGLIVPALTRIHMDYAENVTLDELAEASHVTKSHFCRVFKKTMGVTPVQYLTTYRIDVAYTMLKNTELSCEEISRLCGFEDYSYFNRQFKKVKGISPTGVRKNK